MKHIICVGVWLFSATISLAEVTPPIPSKRSFQVFAPVSYLMTGYVLEPFSATGYLHKLGYVSQAYLVQDTVPSLDSTIPKVGFLNLLEELNAESGILAFLATHGDNDEIAVEFFPPLTYPELYDPSEKNRDSAHLF